MRRLSVHVLVVVLALWTCPATAAEPTVVFDVPYLRDIVIDGKADDWGDGGFRVDAMTPVSGQMQTPEKGDAKFRLGWNDQGLLALVSVPMSST